MVLENDFTIKWKCNNCKNSFYTYSNIDYKYISCKIYYMINNVYYPELNNYLGNEYCSIINLLYSTKKDITTDINSPIDPFYFTPIYIKKLRKKINIQLALSYDEYDDEFKEFIKFCKIN